jgi:hypothetical protein
LGDLCNRCKKFEYFAFRQGNYYLTAYSTQLRFVSSSSPGNSQLFRGYQQVDGTWAFQSLSNGKYIRARNDNTTIDYQTYAGAWERWYMERHGNHVHIQSAQFSHRYWINSGSVLKQLNGGASSVIVEHWPKINWLWNW